MHILCIKNYCAYFTALLEYMTAILEYINLICKFLDVPTQITVV